MPTMLVLQVVAGYTGTEIAEMLDIPRPTVNTRLFRARARLRRILEEGRGGASRKGSR